MRVTANISNDALVQRLQMLGRRQIDLQAEASSGQKLRTAEQDPVAMQRVLAFQAEAQSAAQFQDNIARHQERAVATYSTLDALKKRLDRAQEISVLADDLTGPDEMKTYAAEVRQILEQVVQLANTKHGEEYLFAGTHSLDQPFVANKNPGGTIQSVAYAGNDTLPQSEIAPGHFVSSSIPGASASGSGPRGLLQDSRVGADLFNHLIQLQNALESGDHTQVLAQTDSLKADEDNFLFHITANGALQSRLQASNKIAAAVITNAEKAISNTADADLAETLTQLNQNQTAYQIALQSAAKTMELSLLDFIR